MAISSYAACLDHHRHRHHSRPFSASCPRCCYASPARLPSAHTKTTALAARQPQEAAGTTQSRSRAPPPPQAHSASPLQTTQEMSTSSKHRIINIIYGSIPLLSFSATSPSQRKRAPMQPGFCRSDQRSCSDVSRREAVSLQFALISDQGQSHFRSSSTKRSAQPFTERAKSSKTCARA